VADPKNNSVAQFAFLLAVVTRSADGNRRKVVVSSTDSPSEKTMLLHKLFQSVPMILNYQTDIANQPARE
jgi:hypothetical protein